MSQKTEAQRLAEKMESYSLASGYALHCHKAAAELRRLDQSEREGWRYANELEQERKRLQEANKELLEALKLAQKCMEVSTDKTLLPRAYIAVSAVIAKHGDTK